MKLTPVVLCLIAALLQKADAITVDSGSLCGALLCNGHGVLAQSGSGFVCQCASGFAGTLCDQILPPPCPTTTPVPKPDCQNGGRVDQASDGSYQCNCTAQFYGTLCENAKPNCQNGGSVVRTTNGSYKCKCPPAFTGNLCENPFCQNGGTYTSAGTCTCTGNFYGTQCEKSCPTNFRLLSDASGAPVGCYNFVLAGKTWQGATPYCATLNPNSYLIAVNSAAENTAVKGVISKLSSSDTSQCGSQFFTSGQRATDGNCTLVRIPYEYNFYWKPYNRPQTQIVQGSSFTDWGKDNPNCGNGLYDGFKESCLTFWSGVEWQWNDASCSGMACSVCEVDL